MRFIILLLIIQKRALILAKKDSGESETTEADQSEEESIVGEEEDMDERVDEDKKEDYFYEFEEALQKCDEIIHEMENEGEKMYHRFGPAFHHVLQSTKAHILFLQGKISESREIAKDIQDIEEMSNECKAGIEGLKIRFIMTVYRDYEVLIPLVAKPIELDPEFGYWHYLAGKVKRRHRKDLKEEKIEEELEHFKKAVELEENNPKFLVFLAQAYQEMALGNLKHGTKLNLKKDKELTLNNDTEETFDLNKITEELFQKSNDLFRKCWQLKKDSAPIARRIGNGMNKMKWDFFDKEFVKEVLLAAANLSPNGPYHAIGKFYYYREKDDEEAIKWFKKDIEKAHKNSSRNYSSAELIQLNLIKNPDYDPFEDLKVWLKKDKGTRKNQLAWCDLGWYYLAYKNDLEKSIEYYWKVLQKDSSKVKEFESYAFLVEGPVNMVKVLVNEINLLKEKNEMKPSKEREEFKSFEHFLENILNNHSDLRDVPSDPNLLHELKMKVNKTIESKRWWRNKDSCRAKYCRRGVEKCSQVNERLDYNWRSSDNRGNSSQDNLKNSFSVRGNGRNNRAYNRNDDRKKHN